MVEVLRTGMPVSDREFAKLAPVLDFKALAALSEGVANWEVPQGGAAGDAGE
jgi:hypothetical protein